MAIGFGSLSSINGSNEMAGCELFPLSRIGLIKDRASTFSMSRVKKIIA